MEWCEETPMKSYDVMISSNHEQRKKKNYKVGALAQKIVKK